MRSRAPVAVDRAEAIDLSDLLTSFGSRSGGGRYPGGRRGSK